MPAMMPPSESPSPQSALRSIPSVDALLQQPAIATLLDEYPRGELLRAVRGVLDERRQALLDGHHADLETPGLALAIRGELHRRNLSNLRRVVNATGIVLHTGLGRAPLAAEAVEALTQVAGGYCNLELNLETGERGDRHALVRDLLRELTGAEDALVVNNNAAGTYLALNTLAEQREVIVSRGQLVEIGGSYRMPDIMAAARCRMVEVGTTNRTRLSDYERAITEQTAALLHVHTSNYRVLGFTQSTPLAALAALARKRNLLAIDDLGSGLLDERIVSEGGSSPAPDSAGADEQAAGEAARAGEPAHGQFHLNLGGRAEEEAAWLAASSATTPHWDEPSVRQSLAAGADLVLFSGDKLLGGPQAGVIVGRRELIARLRQNPLARAFRPGKLTLAALEATLRLYRDPETICQRLPVLHKLTQSPAELEAGARYLADLLGPYLPTARIAVRRDASYAGGGSLPIAAFPTWVVEVQLPGVSCAHLAAALRARSVPIIARVHAETLVFDPRTLVADDPEQIAAALGEVVRDLGAS